MKKKPQITQQWALAAPARLGNHSQNAIIAVPKIQTWKKFFDDLLFLIF